MEEVGLEAGVGDKAEDKRGGCWAFEQLRKGTKVPAEAACGSWEKCSDCRNDKGLLGKDVFKNHNFIERVFTYQTIRC